MLAFAREGDEIIVARLDRFTRSSADLHAILADLKARGVTVRFLDNPAMNLDTAQGPLIGRSCPMDDNTFIIFVLGNDPTEALREAVERLCADGLLQYDGTDLRLTAAGLRVLLIHSKSIDPPHR